MRYIEANCRRLLQLRFSPKSTQEVFEADHNALYCTIEKQTNYAVSEHYKNEFDVNALGNAMSLCLIKGITYRNSGNRHYIENSPTLVDDILHQFLSKESNHKGAENKAATKMYNALPENIRVRLSDVHSEVKFNRRGYGSGQCYVWAVHELYTGDPWAATIFPKHILMISLLSSLERTGEINSKEYSWMLDSTVKAAIIATHSNIAGHHHA